MPGDDFGEHWRRCRERTESALKGVFEQHPAIPAGLIDAMRYATLDGGKRLRAMLVYAAGEQLKGCRPASGDVLDAAAAAVELVHAYSLVHDDLPAMDDDDLRRGRPTCHRKFDEATAILAGDALQSLAFEILCDGDPRSLSAERRLRMVNCLAAGIGGSGMAGGQMLDMAATGQTLDLEDLATMHGMKTGALIRTCCVLGGLAVAESTESQLNALDSYGKAIGMAFQIVDDILDVTTDSTVLGKDSGSDDRMHKTTFVSLLGLDEARVQRDRWHEAALENACALGDNGGIFHQIANFVVARSY